MAINKVIYGNQTIIDLTTDTITASKMMAGETAHDRSGNQIVGTGDITGGDISDKTVTFTEASERINISSGETTSTLFGKIKKFFTDLKTVAFTGSYSDLSDKPTIPTVNNATLTIQKNGTNVKTFTANASSDVTANIIVPTKVSDLTNDSGFLTSPVAIAKGGTGATTRQNACKALFTTNMAATDAVGVAALTSGWADTGYLTKTNLKTFLGSMTPSSHASTATTYGVGTASNYGHVKLSDTYASNVGAAANSIGASQSALYNAYAACAKKATAQTFTATQTFDKIIGADASNYVNMQVVAQSNWSSNNATICGYGFHLSGKVGAMLYLQGDGNLYFKYNSGTRYKINMTQA